MSLRKRLGSPGLIPVAAVALVVFTLTLVDLGTKRGTFATGLKVSKSLLVTGFRIPGRSQVFTDADATDPATLWIARANGRDLELVSLYKTGHKVKHFALLRRYSVSGAAGPGNLHYDVARWGRHGALDLFVIRDEGSTADVAVRGLGGAPRILASGRISLPGLPPGGQRSWFAARWSGPNPDLFFVDRGKAPRWRIRVYSGESGFTREIEDARTPLVLSDRLSGREWNIDLGPIVPGDRAKPDLVMVTHGNPSGSHRTEVHVVTGRTDFRHFKIRVYANMHEKTRTTDSFYLQALKDGANVLYLNRARAVPRVRTIPITR